jgi:hypothetical protein
MTNRNKKNKQNTKERKKKLKTIGNFFLPLLDVAPSSSTYTRKWGGNTN